MSDQKPKSREYVMPSVTREAADLEERLAFLELTESDAEEMRRLAPLYESFADEFVKSFYQHLFEHDETARFLRDPALVAHLEKTQREHFNSLMEARWDEQYVERRNMVGLAHADVGLEPHLYLGAYNIFVQHCMENFAANHSPGATEFVTQILPLMKVVFLDIGLSLDAYFLQGTSNLRHALDMYWKANDDLRRFAHLTSHDLKTPIATVMNLCEEVVDEFGDQMPEEAVELIKSAHKRSMSMSTMIDELLESTLTSHATTADDELSSDEPIRQALERLEPAMQRKGVEVVLPASWPKVWGNRVRLREAFYNILSNATKFINQRPGRIEIDYTIEDSRCKFTVTDNGPGIPPEDLESIFAPFRRLAKHRNEPGTGLGLYFAKHLLESDGGQLWAEDTQGQGARFCISLPCPPSS